MDTNKMEQFKNQAIIWLKNKVKKAGLNGLSFGMSGGIDSSVIAVLSKLAFPDAHIGVFINVDSLQEDFSDAKLVADKFGINFSTIDLTNLYGEFRNLLAGRFGDNHQVASANLKARLRMCTLYYIANKSNYLVVGTGNRSELLVGYFTKYGDGGVDILPIGNLYKFQVRELAKHLGIPKKIITKPPSAGLWTGQKDEEELGITYNMLDAALQKIFDKKKIKVSESIVKKVKSFNERGKQKLSMPEVFISKNK